MRRLYPFFPTVLKENVQNSMNGLEKYFPFRRDMGCLAITARHVVGNKTTCKDFRTKTKLEQDRARSIRDFLTCWDRESKAISMDLETVCGPCCVLLSRGWWAHRQVWLTAFGSGLCLTFLHLQFPSRKGWEAWEMSCPEPSPAVNGLLSACQGVPCAQGQIPGMIQLLKWALVADIMDYVDGVQMGSCGSHSTVKCIPKPSSDV